jgi:hypothetical protein
MYAQSANRVRAQSVVNYRMSKLLKPAFAAQIHSAQSGVPYSHALRVFHTMGLEAHTMGLVSHTIGLAVLLEDGLVLEFLVMRKCSSRAFQWLVIISSFRQNVLDNFCFPPLVTEVAIQFFKRVKTKRGFCLMWSTRVKWRVHSKKAIQIVNNSRSEKHSSHVDGANVTNRKYHW